MRDRTRRLDDRHRRAEPAEGLRQFEPDRPGADDQEMRWQFLEVEDRLVG